MTRRGVGRGVAALACIGAISGCGASTGAGPTSSQSATTSTSDQGSSTQPTTTSADRSAPVLASATSSDRDIPLELQLNQLSRDGSLMTLNFTIRNAGAPRDPSAPNAASQGDKWQVSGFLDDGASPPGDISQLDTVDGIYVLDQANRKKYPVVHDSKGVCVCSGNGGATFVSPGQSIRFYATFGAPPPDVKRVDVAIPHFGTINSVPIEG